MVQAELQKYVSEQLAHGVSSEEIKKAVLASGWNDKDVADTFAAMNLSTPASAAPVTATATPVQNVVKKPMDKKMILGVIFAALVVLGGGSAFAYYKYTTSPDYVVAKMFTADVDVTSMEFDGSMDMNFTTVASSSAPALSQKVSFGFNGGFDVKDEKDPKVSANVSVNYQGMLAKPVSADLVYAGKSMYFRINDAPDLGASLPLSELNGLWFSLTESDLASLTEMTATTTVSPTGTLTPAQTKQVMEAVKKHKVFVLKETKADEVVNGVSTYHYVFTMDKNGLIPFMKEVAPITGETFTAEQEAQLKESLEMFDTISGEIWVGKKDYMPYRLSLVFGIKPNESMSSGNMTMTMSFKNFNKAFNVTVPSGATPAAEFFNGMMPSEDDYEYDY